MAGRKPKLEPSRTAFLAELAAAANLVAAIHKVPSSVKASTSPTLHQKYKVQVVELAFMAIVAAWEEYLEATLIRYVAGAKTASGYAPTPKFGIASNIGHAYQVLSGKTTFNPESDYIKASDAAWVRSKANFVFSSHPYNCLTPRAQQLSAANTIRNRVAHASIKCKAEFKTVALQLLALPVNGKLKQSFTAGNLLLVPTTANFGAAIPANSNHFNAFVHIYTHLAHTIVP